MIITESAARGWRTVRRFAVPAAMIGRATERRLAGDWRLACAAADVHVDLDLLAVGRQYGESVAAAIEEDVRHLAPDLLRWHLPRRPGTGHTALSPRRLSVLQRYGDGGPILCAGSPRTGYGRQQLRLFVAAEPLRTERDPAAYRGDREHEPATWYQHVDLDLPRHVWDARRSGELLSWYGLRDTSPPIEHLGDLERFAAAWARVGIEAGDYRWYPLG
ncbi:hypothetical protein [Dactylosporangium sp. CS-033363]|uniref:hypothetical protein n=1 Tax=Dactylosporangium sp. CS-033363 TaxID=3239935 RepID=UPI003D8C6A98